MEGRVSEGSVRSPFGVRSGSVRDSFVVRSGSVRGRFGLHSSFEFFSARVAVGIFIAAEAFGLWGIAGFMGSSIGPVLTISLQSLRQRCG